MTNNQYETLCISNALLGQAKLAAVDAKITETEQALVFLLHARREIVNQYDLNKPNNAQIEYEEYERRCKEWN